MHREAWTPFCVSSRDAGLTDCLLPASDERGQLAADVALQGADRFQLEVALCNAAGRARLGPCVGLRAPDGDDVQRRVGCSIATPIEAMAHRLAEEAGTGLTPHNAAKPSSERRRSGLSAAVRRS